MPYVFIPLMSCEVNKWSYQKTACRNKILVVFKRQNSITFLLLTPVLNSNVDLVNFPQGKGLLVSVVLLICCKDISHLVSCFCGEFLMTSWFLLGFCLNVWFIIQERTGTGSNSVVSGDSDCLLYTSPSPRD